MLIPAAGADFDIPIVCHAEVDLPAWLAQLTGKSGWKLDLQDESDLCNSYEFRCGRERAQVVLFHTGYATVDVDDRTLYDGSLLAVSGCTSLHYYNAESGGPLMIH
jgi:hypothetical protein